MLRFPCRAATARLLPAIDVSPTESTVNDPSDSICIPSCAVNVAVEPELMLMFPAAATLTVASVDLMSTASVAIRSKPPAVDLTSTPSVAVILICCPAVKLLLASDMMSTWSEANRPTLAPARTETPLPASTDTVPALDSNTRSVAACTVIPAEDSMRASALASRAMVPPEVMLKAPSSEVILIPLPSMVTADPVDSTLNVPADAMEIPAVSEVMANESLLRISVVPALSTVIAPALVSNTAEASTSTLPAGAATVTSPLVKPD